MLQSEQINDLYKSLTKAQSEFKKIPFDKTNPHFKSKYASLQATQEMIRSIMGLNGLALIQSVESRDNKYCIETRLIHSSGQFISSSFDLIISQNNMQGLGSAITYAKRYAAQALLGISGDDDDDGNAASGKADKEASRARQPGRQGNQELVPRGTNSESKKVDPMDFVLNLGTVKNTKLKDIPIEKLNTIAKWLSDSIKNEPNGKNRRFHGLVYGNIKEVLKKKNLITEPELQMPDLDDAPMPEEHDLINYAEPENPFEQFEQEQFREPIPEIVDKVVINVDIPNMDVNGIAIDMLEIDDLNVIIKELDSMIHSKSNKGKTTELFVLQSKIKKYLKEKKS